MQNCNVIMMCELNTCSYQSSIRHPPPIGYASDLQSSSEVTIAVHPNLNRVPNLIHQQNHQNIDTSHSCEVTVNHRSHQSLKHGNAGANDSTSVGSNVDTLDSGFSSERFHSTHHHQPILPGDQVI